MSPPHIFLFGNDAHLLETRRWVLEAAGYEVGAATRFLALNQIAADHPIDILILCHSLTQEEGDRVQSVVIKHFPKSKVLALAVNDLTTLTADGAQVVYTGDGPKPLLDAIDHLVSDRMPPEASSDGAKTRADASASV